MSVSVETTNIFSCFKQILFTHVSNECSLAPLRSSRRFPQSYLEDMEVKGSKGRSAKICYSWNDDQCTIGPYCRYRHACAKCGSGSHKAMHCYLPSVNLKKVETPRTKRTLFLPRMSCGKSSLNGSDVIIIHYHAYPLKKIPSVVHLRDATVHLSFDMCYYHDTIIIIPNVCGAGEGYPQAGVSRVIESTYNIYVPGYQRVTRGYSLSVFPDGKYDYMEDLKVLASRVSPVSTGSLPSAWCAINSPLIVSEWQQQLDSHPDREFVQYLLKGMAEGFRIGFNYEQCNSSSAKRNMQSAIDNPQVVREYLAREGSLGRIVGPLESGTSDIVITDLG